MYKIDISNSQFMVNLKYIFQLNWTAVLPDIEFLDQTKQKSFELELLKL